MQQPCLGLNLASINRRSENIVVKPIIIFELAFRDVEREIFSADLVIAADNRPLEDRPEAFNRVGVYRADNVALGGMMNALVRVIGQSAIDAAFVSRQQANFIRDDFADKLFAFILADCTKDTGDYATLAAHSANNGGLSRGSVLATAPALIPVLVLVLAADESFIDLDNATKLRLRLDKSGADLVTHAPSGFVRAEAHEPHDLEGAHSLFASQHQVSDLEPVPERLVCILEDCTGDMGETVGGRRGASVALPVEAVLKRRDLYRAATGAMNSIGPAPGDQIAPAGFLIGESRLELGVAHLVDWFRTAGHRYLPDYERTIPCQTQ